MAFWTAPLLLSPLQGLLFPSPPREEELTQRVAAGCGQSPWHACVTGPPAPASFTLPDPAPSAHGAASSLRQKGSVRRVLFRPCSLFFLMHGGMIRLGFCGEEERMLWSFTKSLCTSCCWRGAALWLGEIFLRRRLFEAMRANRGVQSSLPA